MLPPQAGYSLPVLSFIYSLDRGMGRVREGHVRRESVQGGVCHWDSGGPPKPSSVALLAWVIHELAVGHALDRLQLDLRLFVVGSRTRHHHQRLRAVRQIDCAIEAQRLHSALL